jgi:dTMP kinase
MQSHQNPGFLIAIEGIDGAGKTTQAHLVQAALQARNLPVIRSKEPTTGKWGQILRDSALTGRLSLEEEVEAFIKDRHEHVTSVIDPALEAGHIVIVDRYYFSNMAYQGARGYDVELLRVRNEAIAPEPDLLVILDIEPKMGLERIRLRGDRANHFEQSGQLSKIRQIFLSIAKPYKYVLDARLSAEEITTLIVRQLVVLYTEKIARSNLSNKEQLSATLKLFGGSSI